MAVCTFDNPATFQRECWRDKKLICAYSFEVFAIRPLPGLQPIPPEHFFFGANVGPINPGQMWGDPEAIGDPEATEPNP